MTEALTITAPDVGGKPSLPKRDGTRRSMFPTTWLDRAVVVEYINADGHGVSTNATVLDFCGLGLIANIGGGRCIIAWDALRLVELRGD